MRIASKTGRLFASPELSEKLWSKMLGDLGKRIKEAFERKYQGNTIGIIPRVLFSYRYLENECKDAAFKRALKDLSFCNNIPIPGYYQKSEKRFGIRKSKTYKGKPHPSHARIEPRGRALISTGISLAIPIGLYGRILSGQLLYVIEVALRH